MATLEKRIESLEKSDSKQSAIRVVFCESGETTAQAITRTGATDDGLTLIVSFGKGEGQ